MTNPEPEVMTDFARVGDSDWIAKLTPLLVLDIISLSLLFGGEYEYEFFLYTYVFGSTILGQ